MKGRMTLNARVRGMTLMEQGTAEKGQLSNVDNQEFLELNGESSPPTLQSSWVQFLN